MINFVVYAKERKECDFYENIIGKFLFSTDDCYDVLKFDKFSLDIEEQIRKTEGVKIYILDIDSPMNGIDFAKRIRINGDLNSPIILLTEKKDEGLLEKLNNVLYLSLISKNRNGKEFILSLKEAYRIATMNAVLSFTHFDETYRLSYDDICYIEKDANCNSVTIYSLDDTYQDYISIKEMCEKLKGDPRFYRSHRSCIVNIYNIASYDRKNNLIIFKNGLTTYLVARNKRRTLIKKLEENLEDVHN